MMLQQKYTETAADPTQEYTHGKFTITDESPTEAAGLMQAQNTQQQCACFRALFRTLMMKRSSEQIHLSPYN